jgi:ABC-type Mn2+/Zn2+ transport system ATPase subunit
VSEPIEIRNVSVFYGPRAALESVSLAVGADAQVAIVGPNGAGKSTLFKAMVGLLPVATGEMVIAGQPLSARRDIAYVPQREEVDWRFPVTVLDVVAMGRYGRGKWLRRLSRLDREIVHESMETLGIGDLGQRPIGDLSGGQQQRVFLARALTQQPRVLLLDEPFTGVDVATREATLDVLAGLRNNSVTVLISTHDLDLAAERFDQVVLLNGRLIAAGAPHEVFTEQHLHSAFGGQMVVVNGKIVVVDQCCCGSDGDRSDRQ